MRKTIMEHCSFILTVYSEAVSQNLFDLSLLPLLTSLSPHFVSLLVLVAADSLLTSMFGTPVFCLKLILWHVHKSLCTFGYNRLVYAILFHFNCFQTAFFSQPIETRETKDNRNKCIC